MSVRSQRHGAQSLGASQLFDAKAVSLLLRPSDWRLVSSQAPADLAPAGQVAASRVLWSRRHAHAHHHAEFLFVLSGRGFFGWNGRVYPFRPGVVFHLGSQEPHDLGYPASAPPAVHLWVSLVADSAAAFVVRLGNGRAGFSSQGRRVLPSAASGVALAQFLSPSHGGGAPAALRRQRVIAGLAALLVKVVEASFLPESAPPDPNAFQRQVIDAVMRHIRETAGRGGALDSLARMAGYSKYHFLRLFQKHAGLTVHQYVDQCRREAVQRMIAQGRTHLEMGETLGFSCPSAFSRWLHSRRP